MHAVRQRDGTEGPHGLAVAACGQEVGDGRQLMAGVVHRVVEEALIQPREHVVAMASSVFAINGVDSDFSGVLKVPKQRCSTDVESAKFHETDTWRRAPRVSRLPEIRYGKMRKPL